MVDPATIIVVVFALLAATVLGYFLGRSTALTDEFLRQQKFAGMWTQTKTTVHKDPPQDEGPSKLH
jgi:hypothetical protein